MWSPPNPFNFQNTFSNAVNGTAGAVQNTMGNSPSGQAYAAGPQRPEFQSILGPGGGLQSQYMASAQGYTPSTYEAQKMSTNMNPWLSLQKQRISGEQAQNQDRLQGDVQTGIGSGFSNLAASGGLDSGARERLMTSSNAQRMRGMTDLNAQSSASRLDAGMQAEMMRKQAQQFNAQAQNQAGQFNAGAQNQAGAFGAGAQNQASMFNTGNAIGGVGAQNAFNSNVYNQQMGAWGAGRTADAMARSANQGQGGFGSIPIVGDVFNMFQRR